MGREEIETAGRAGRRHVLRTLPLQARTIDVDGAETSVLEGGRGPTLVLLHGAIPTGGLVWWRVVARLVEHHRVIIPDVPGLGESAPLARLGATTLTDWLASAVTALCDEPPTLVGHSNPGSMAARLAARDQSLVRRLVLVGVPGLGRWRPPSPAFVATVIRMAMRPSERNIERFAAGWCYRDLDRIRREEGERHDAFEAYYLERASTPSVKRAMRRVIRAGTERIDEVDLGRIDVPTTLLWGAHDQLVSPDIGKAASDTFGWPLELVDDAGHLPHVDRPDAFVDALEAAIGSVSR